MTNYIPTGPYIGHDGRKVGQSIPELIAKDLWFHVYNNGRAIDPAIKSCERVIEELYYRLEWLKEQK